MFLYYSIPRELEGLVGVVYEDYYFACGHSNSKVYSLGRKDKEGSERPLSLTQCISRTVVSKT